jgi:RNA polymerase sigma-70 factor (ECF subfamily)
MSNATSPVPDGPDWGLEMAAVAARRDRDSFMRIYDHFMPRLCLYLRGVGVSEAVAEDLAQESLLRLWQRAAEFDPARSAVSTWVFRIARNLHIDRLRREAWRGMAPLSEDVEPIEEAGSAERYADGVQLRRRIEALSPVQARLIRMSYFEAKSHQDIASELSMPLGTVKSHLRRAFARLQDDMGGAP